MTTVSERHLRRPTGRRLADVLIVVASGCVGLLVIGKWTLGTFNGGGADMAHHYELVYWLSHHWALPPAHGSLGDMTRYPPGAHLLAALVGRLVGSAFRGMQLVAVAGIVLIWCAIAALLTTLPGRRRWVALSLLAAVLLLDTTRGPLMLDVHGFEIVSNFFFAEAVGQAIVWWVVWLVVRRRIAGRSPVSTALLVALIAVLATVVHLVPAVELLVLASCLCAAGLVERWRAGLRGLRLFAVPVVLPVATVVAIALTPGFRSMRALSANNGSLDVPYLSGLADYIAVAAAVAVISVLVLMLSVSRRKELATAAVLQGLGFVGIAIAVPCLLQAAALDLGQGSQYAVKKYIFGLLTVLVVDACAVVSALAPRPALESSAPRTAVRFSAVVALAVVATLAVLSHPGSGYSMSRITTLERQVTTVAAAAHLSGRRSYTFGLPGSDPVLDYMFSLTELGDPTGPIALSILRGRPQLDRGAILTASSSAYDVSSCRRFGPRDGLVVIGATCWNRAANKCRTVNVLSERGQLSDPRLRGFSSAEPTGRWTDGKSASFSCVLAESGSRRPIAIAIAATAFLPAPVTRQRVRLAVGGEHESFVFTPKAPQGVLRLVVPPPKSGRLEVTLTLPDAVSPHALGLSIDARVLGLFISQIRVS